MPITVTTTDGGLGSIMRGEGLVTGQEILNGIAERFSSEEKTRGYIYGISDYTNVEKIEMSSAEVRQVAENDVHMARLNADLVIAIAAPQDIMFGLSRMFEAYASDTGWVIGVFRSLEEAENSILTKLKERQYPVQSITFE